MSSFKDIRDFVFVGYAHDMFDDEEFCLLYDFYQSKNPDFPYNSYVSFDLGEMDPAECYTEFRVEKWHIPLLADRLQIPPTFQCPQRSVCDGIEGLCMLLKRLAYPCRYSDMVHRFARPVPVLSMITNTVPDYVYDRHGHRLTQWNHRRTGNVLSGGAVNHLPKKFLQVADFFTKQSNRNEGHTMQQHRPY